MRIVELTELQFANYAKIHESRNIYQSVEYANMMESQGYKKVYLGFCNDNDNVLAATLILESTNNKIKSGYAPGGYLIDFNNLELLKSFTDCLRNYLEAKKYIYLRLNPNVDYKVYNKDGNIAYANNNLIEFLKNLGYNHLGFTSSFERYKGILEVNSNINDTYQKFNYNTRKNIERASLRAINVFKGDENNLELFYKLLPNKKKLDYYSDYLKYFTGNNKFELYFAKIDSKSYINNYRYLLKKEQAINEKLNNLMQDSNYKKTTKLINKKMLSDKRINKYNNEIVKATKLYTDYPEGLVIGTVAILRNDKEVRFMYEGHNNEYSDIYSSYLIKWEIIKQYLNNGYKFFDLGNVAPNLKKENNPNYGLYRSKVGFNASIHEYPGEFDLVINKLLYKMFSSINLKKKK